MKYIFLGFADNFSWRGSTGRQIILQCTLLILWNKDLFVQTSKWRLRAKICSLVDLSVKA